MKKVCHLTSAHPSNDIRVFYKECTSLAKAEYEVYLVARGESRVENNVNVIGLGAPPKSRLSRMISFAKKVYKTGIDIDADIYHIHDPEMLPYGIKLRKLGKKVIFDSHENYSLQLSSREYLPKVVRKFIGSIYHAYETYAVKRFDAVIVPCTFNGKNIFANRAQKTVFIANYQAISDIKKYADTTIEKKNRSFCYAGTIRFANGLTNAVKVAGKTNSKLLLAGRFSSEDYKEELQSMPEYKNVEFMGVIPYSEVISLYQSSQIGYYVELPIGQNDAVDTFGMKVYEYMSLGIPILVDDSRYARSVIDKYKCGIYVDPYDVDKIAEALEFLFDNPEIADEFGKNGKDAVEKEFNWETQEKKLLELYSEIISA